MTVGVGPSARFSMAGSTLHPHNGGVLIFMGGCNKSLEALDDMFYLHTGMYVIQGRILSRTQFFAITRRTK